VREEKETLAPIEEINQNGLEFSRRVAVPGRSLFRHILSRIEGGGEEGSELNTHSSD